MEAQRRRRNYDPELGWPRRTSCRVCEARQVLCCVVRTGLMTQRATLGSCCLVFLGEPIATSIPQLRVRVYMVGVERREAMYACVHMSLVRAGYQQCVSNELEALRTAQKDARPSSFWGRTPGTYTLDEFSRVMNDIAYNDSVAYDTLAREVGVEPAVVDAMLERNFLFYHPTRRVIMHRSPLFKVVFATKKRRKN